ncbi:MAG: hypothetical protein HYT48_02195 [Candidatus Vogelbacteria bacterium]|nr:hypothetical protein [Candidatus Vogelbacteria bacterium]
MPFLFELAYAACPDELPLLTSIKTAIVNPILMVLFALALLYFLYGVFELIRDAKSEDAVKTGRQHIIYGVIGMFIMVSVFGIINLIYTTFNIPIC